MKDLVKFEKMMNSPEHTEMESFLSKIAEATPAPDIAPPPGWESERDEESETIGELPVPLQYGIVALIADREYPNGEGNPRKIPNTKELEHCLVELVRLILKYSTDMERAGRAINYLMNPPLDAYEL